MRFFSVVKLCALSGLAVSGALAQDVTPKPLPLPTPDSPIVQRRIDLPERPIPTAERVGVDAANGLSLTLADAIERALSNNNDIDSSRKTRRIADFSLLRARGAYDPLASAQGYYESITTPTASAIGGAVNGSVTQTRFVGDAGVTGFSPFYGGSYGVQFNNSRTTTSNTNSFLNPQFPSSLVLSYTQPLLRNFGFDANRREIEIAKRNQNLTDAQLRQQAIQTIAGVEQAYWDLTFALRNLEVQRETLLQARAQLASNQRLVDQGVLAPIELVASNVQVYTFEQTVYTAQDAITTAENTLKTLILPDRTAPEWSRPILPVSPIEIEPPRLGLEVALTEALRSRPEITQLDETAEINRIDQRFFRNQKKPQVDIISSFTSQGLAGTETPAAISPTTGISRVPPNLVGGPLSSLGNLLAFDYPSYRVGVALSLPIRNRVARANLATAVVDGERIANTRAQTEQTVEAEVRNALQSMRSLEARLESAAAAHTAAEELFRSEERLFRGGTSTFYLVAQRQNELAIARARELQARRDLNKAISEFQRSIGRTLEVNNISVAP